MNIDAVRTKRKSGSKLIRASDQYIVITKRYILDKAESRGFDHGMAWPGLDPGLPEAATTIMEKHMIRVWQSKFLGRPFTCDFRFISALHCT
jgi:hypothetical protein